MFRNNDKRSKAAMDFAVKRLIRLQKVFSVIALILTFLGVFLSPAVYAFGKQEDVEIVGETIEESERILPDLYEGRQIDPQFVAIQSEDISKRTVNEKHFKKVDGTYEVAIYNNAVHYQKDGKW